MKKLGVLFAVVLMMFSFTTLKAQKIGHADVAGILQAMPEMQAAQKKLDEFAKVKQGAIQKLSEELQTKIDAYKKSGKRDAAKEAEFNKQLQHIQEMGKTAQEDMVKKQNELFAPIDAKLRKAVDAVGKAKGLDYILDGNSQAIIYKNGPDVTNDIKKQLGM